MLAEFELRSAADADDMNRRTALLRGDPRFEPGPIQEEQSEEQRTEQEAYLRHYEIGFRVS